MDKYILYGSEFVDIESSYNHIKEVFNFNDYFGNNLDALWDSLSEYYDIKIEIINARLIPRNLGDYGLKILDVFGDLQRLDGYEINIYW